MGVWIERREPPPAQVEPIVHIRAQRPYTKECGAGNVLHVVRVKDDSYPGDVTFYISNEIGDPASYERARMTTSDLGALIDALGQLYMEL